MSHWTDAMTRTRPAGLSTTGAGSLPHTQSELALQMALSVDVPYAPQLPRHNDAELMVLQALEGLPGVSLRGDGSASVDAAVWAREGAAFHRQLDVALGHERQDTALPNFTAHADEASLSRFEPTPFAQSAWRPFLWEVESRKMPFAKVQVAGPTTLRWLVSLSDGRRVTDEPSLEHAIVRLCLARAWAMARAVRARGATPIVCFDEPGLYALRPADPMHLVHVQEMKLAALAMQRTGALTALHCCGNTAWATVLGIGFDYLWIDVRLSLSSLLRAAPELEAFARTGGRLILGVVPTNSDAPYDLEQLVSATAAALEPGQNPAPSLRLEDCLLAPACGLGLRSVVDAERVFEDLRIAQRALRRTTKRG